MTFATERTETEKAERLKLFVNKWFRSTNQELPTTYYLYLFGDHEKIKYEYEGTSKSSVTASMLRLSDLWPQNERSRDKV